MALTIVSGEWGTGKTKYLVELAEKRWNEGCVVVTNFECAFAHLDCSKDSPQVFLWKLGMLVEMKMRGIEIGNIFPAFALNTICVFIDEGSLYFSPEIQDRMRKRDEESYNRFQTLLAQVRKLTIEVYVTCQTIGRLGKDIRRLADEYIHLRWLISMPYYKYTENPDGVTIRQELRNRIKLQWIEHHQVDADSPQYNYKKQLNENGYMVYAPSATIIGRPKIRSDYGKDYQFGVYHSYQAIGVSVVDLADFKTEDVDFGFILTDLCYIPRGFKRERFPTFKRLFRKLGLKVRIRDEELPTKVYFKDLFIPNDYVSHDEESKLNKQEKIKVPSEELKQLFFKAYSKGKIPQDSIVLRLARSEAARAKEAADGPQSEPESAATDAPEVK